MRTSPTSPQSAVQNGRELGENVVQFLVCYDYGTGGLWWRMTATSASQIEAKYRDLTVFEQPPEWWTEEMERLAHRCSVEDEPDGALAMLVR